MPADLVEAVRDRYSEQLLVELTNPGVQGDASVNDLRLRTACDDAEAEFLTQAGVAFDLSNAEHVAACVLGAVYYLHLYSGMQTDLMARTRTLWENRLEAISVRVGSRRRIRPTSSSTLIPSTQRVGQQPDFDRARFDDVVARLPGGETETED